MACKVNEVTIGATYGSEMAKLRVQNLDRNIRPAPLILNSVLDEGKWSATHNGLSSLDENSPHHPFHQRLTV
jgi:hypothetical protein